MEGEESRREKREGIGEPDCIADESYKRRMDAQGLLTNRYIDQVYLGTDVLDSKIGENNHGSQSRC